MIIHGKYKRDQNFITVYAENCIYTIARATGEWGSVRVGQLTFMGGFLIRKPTTSKLLVAPKRELLSFRKKG